MVVAEKQQQQQKQYSIYTTYFKDYFKTSTLGGKLCMQMTLEMLEVNNSLISWYKNYEVESPKYSFLNDYSEI